MAPRMTWVLPNDTLLCVLMPLASSANTIMWPSSLPSVSILEPTRTRAVCAITLVANEAAKQIVAMQRR